MAADRLECLRNRFACALAAKSLSHISCALFAQQLEFPTSRRSSKGKFDMHYVVIGRDKLDPELRKAARADHLEYIATQQDRIIYAGPLLEDGHMVGSLFIFEVPDRAALDSHFAEDPYFTRGIFATVEIFESRWMVPERTPGALREEAAKARLA